MPTKFTGVIDGPQNPTATREQYFGDATGVAKNIETMASVAGQMQDERILSKFQDSILGETPDTSEYDSQLRDVKQRLYDASSRNDKEAMANYIGQLEKLRRAESSGVMSPTASSLRLQMLTKEWANRYPHLATKFKTLYNEAASGGYGGKSAPEDPVQKGIDEVLQESFRTGRSVADIWEDRRIADTDARLTHQINIKMKMGDDVKPELENQATNFVTALVKKAREGMIAEAKAGNLDGANWTIQLGEARDFAKKELMNKFAEIEKNGVILGREWKDGVLNSTLKAFDDLAAAAQRADSSDRAGRMADNMTKVTAAGLDQELVRSFGYRGALVVKYPNLSQFLAKAVAAQQALSKPGGKKALWEAVAAEDPETAGIAAWLGDGNLTKLVIDNLGFTLNSADPQKPGEQPTQDPLEHYSPRVRRIATANLLSALRQPGMSPEDYSAIVVRAANESPDLLAKDATALSMITNIPNLREKVNQTFANWVVGISNEMDPADFDLIQMSGAGQPGNVVQTKDAPTNAAVQAAADASVAAFGYPAKALDTVLAADPANKMASLLNTYYEVMVGSGMAPEEAKQQVGKQLAGVIQMRTESAQRPTQAQQAEADKQKVIDAQSSVDSLEKAGDMVIKAIQEGKMPAKLGAEFLRIFNTGSSQVLDKLEPGIYRDKKTGILWTVTEKGMKQGTGH